MIVVIGVVKECTGLGFSCSPSSAMYIWKPILGLYPLDSDDQTFLVMSIGWIAHS